MSSYDLGKNFEIVTYDFFVWLFKEIEVQVNNKWNQKAGYQFGFDVGFQVAILNDDFFKREIYIECKNYDKTVLDKTQLVNKLIQVDMSPYNFKNSIFIFLSPKVDLKRCSQDSYPVLLENYFFDRFGLKTIILTPENNIKEILALNSEIYFRVFDEEIMIESNPSIRNEILNYFKRLLFSKGEIPNFKLVKEREKYLEEASINNVNEFYIERKLKTNKFSFFNEDKSLIELLKENDNILLLGEPGSGKTTELKNVAKYFEEKISIIGITPIFINLSNIKEFNSIEDFFPAKWKSNNRILLLFDSLDEFEFRSKLSEQIESLLKLKDISFKIIVSCRTYAYNEELSSFKPVKFYLDGFKDKQIIEILNKLYNLPIEEFDNVNKYKFKDILEDPFMLNRFGLYFKKNKNTPNEINEIYDDIISELKYDDVEVYKIFALILELTKSISIEKDELRSLFGLKYKKLIKLEFIQKSFDKQSFKFTHKNYQEYFAALALSELSYEDIINFIVIKGTKKTHPSLFNTITFLINILGSEKCNSLIQWFVVNEPELLFKADKNRIESYRVKVFQEYFYNQCIVKTYWINNNRTFSVKEIAEFGNCDENFDYLHSVIIDKKSHFRAIISALDLLSYFKIPLNKIDELKKDFLVLLNNKDIRDNVKSNILNCIEDQRLIQDDDKYLGFIFEIFREETNKEINSALLSLLKDYNIIDEFFWYVREEFLRENKIKPRDVEDKVIRGNKWKLENIIISFKDSNNFIALAKYYFDETKSDYNDSVFSKSLIERCLFFETYEDDFVIRLLSSFEDKVRFYLREDLLKNLILKSKVSSQIGAFNYLIDNFTFNNVGYFLASITNSETIGIVVDKFIDGTIESKELDFFRNVIANHGNRELAKKFNDDMILKGFVFNEPFLSIERYQELKMRFDTKPQENFDLLFNKPKLLDEIKKIFLEHGDYVKPEIMRDIDMKWYEKNGHGNIIDIQYLLLSRLVYKNKKEVSYEDIEDVLKDEFILIKEIKAQIKNQKEGENKFTLKGYQIDCLNEWCIKASEELFFDDIIQVIDANHFRIGKDYELLRVILYFNFKFNFNLSQDFLLNSIMFFDVDLSNVEDNNLETLKLKIEDDEKFNQRILDNLLNEKLASFSLNKHIQYVIDNRLSDAFFKVREFFLISDYNVNDKILRDYIDLTNDYLLLKELCHDVRSHSCWSSIKILMDLGVEVGFCTEKAVEYLNTNIDDEKNYYYSNALSVLFQNNSIDALKYLENFIDLDKSLSLSQNSYASYSIVEDYNVLVSLFNKIYLGDMDKIGYNGVTNFLEKYVSNLSNTKEGHKETMSVLKKIKRKLEKTSKENGLFYINNLIDNSDKSYISSQSKALTFAEALSKVDEILN